MGLVIKFFLTYFEPLLVYKQHEGTPALIMLIAVVGEANYIIPYLFYSQRASHIDHILLFLNPPLK